MDKDLAMSRRIGCPHCGKQLNVPPELAGKKVACPRCTKQFRFEFENGDDPSSIVIVPIPNPDLFPPDSGPTYRPATSPGKMAAGQKTFRQTAPATGSSSTGSSSTGSSSTESDVGAPPTHDPERDTQTARFIEREASATNVKLGADGRLPDLALATQEKRVDVGNASKSSNPWLLVAVLGISVLMSVLVLVIDEPQPGRTPGKSAAHQELSTIFAAWERTDAPAGEVRDLLAHALQAYNRGDSKREKECYRQILDLLNAEDAPRYGGYSGNDIKLKEAIGELLR